MIHTLTLNPAIDRIYYLSDMKWNSFNRARSTVHAMGGKGTLVAMNLVAMGIACNAFGHFGGKTGEEIVRILKEHGVVPRYIPDKKSESRTNLILMEDDGTCTMVAERGVEPEEQRAQQLLNLMEREIQPGDSLVLSGDASNYSDHDIYGSLCRNFSAKQVRIYLDASGETLRRSLEARPFLIKPNQDELTQLLRRDIVTDKDILCAIDELDAQYQIPVIAVSLGEKGSIVKLQGGKILRAVPPKMKYRNSAGCGDCFLAGIISGIERNYNDEEIVRRATAYAAAKVESELTFGINMERMKEIYPMINIETLRKGEVEGI